MLHKQILTLVYEGKEIQNISSPKILCSKHVVENQYGFFFFAFPPKNVKDLSHHSHSTQKK